VKAPSKWLLLFLLFLLGALALGWTLFGAFTSKDYEKLSAAYQAFFAYTGIFPALAALLVAFQSETRATQADARALASETEANQVRQAALLQAQATHDLATATREQSAILQLQEARTTAATLVLVHTGGFGVNANFSLINLSTQNMFIYGVR
jgi:Zn-dependent protease with chaperone function